MIKLHDEADLHNWFKKNHAKLGIEKILKYTSKGQVSVRYLAIIVILVAALAASILLIVYPPFTLTGASTAGGIEWEHQLQITADSSQQTVLTHIIFDQYKTADCRDIYIEANGQNIPFRNENESIINGTCTETDIVFDNIGYQPPPGSFVVNEADNNSIIYDVYYGKIQATTMPELQPITQPELSPSAINYRYVNKTACAMYIPNSFGTEGFSVNAIFYYNNITAALAAASAGDEIGVCPGTYTENIGISKSLNIYSLTGPSNTKITAFIDDDVVIIANTNYVNLSGFNITGSTSFGGILLSNANYTNISSNVISYNGGQGVSANSNKGLLLQNNTVHNCSYGIEAYNSANASIINNTVYKIRYRAITLQDATYTNVTNNTVYTSQHGIYVNAAARNLVVGNTVYNTTIFGILLDGSLCVTHNNSIINNNASYNNYDFGSYTAGHCDNVVTNLTMKQNVVSFKGNQFLLKGLNSTQAPSGYPSSYRNISKWVNATNYTTGSWLYLNVSYTHADINNVNESNLSIARFNGTWQTDTSKFAAANSFGVNKVANYVYANITNFGSTFEPLGTPGISVCQNITAAGTYTLAAALSGNQSSGRCIDIQFDNVMLDCANYNMTSTIPYTMTGPYGIYTNSHKNITIKNCNITNYTRAVYLINSNQTNVTYSNGSNGRTGIWLENSTGCNISYNRMSNFLEAISGIHLVGTNQTIIFNNTVLYGGGITLDVSYYNNITRNNASFGYGIGINSGSNNNVINNTMYNNSDAGRGVLLWGGASYNNVTNNTANLCSFGFEVRGYSNTLTNNTIANSTNYGITIADANADYNNFTNNTVFNSTSWDVYTIGTPSHNKIVNLTLAGPYPAKIDFTYTDDISIIGVKTPPSNPAYNYRNISKWINVTNNTAGGSIFLNVSYNSTDLGIIDATTLRMARYNGTWETNTSKFANVFNVSTTANYVYANITAFGSIFAPLSNPIVAGCMNIATNGTWTLTQDLSGNQTTGRCIDVQVDNVTIDCNSKNINGIYAGTTRGIYAASRKNITIKNCNITNYWHGIHFDTVSNSTINNNTFSGNTEGGMWLATAANYNNITNNNASYNARGIMVYYDSKFNRIINNTLNNNSAYGVVVAYGPANNSIINNTANLNGQWGIWLTGYTSNGDWYNNITNNTANSNTYDGIRLDNNASYNRLVNNSLSNNNRWGIYLDTSSAFNTIVYNNASNNNNSGIRISSSSNNIITNNTFSSNVLSDFSSASGSINNIVTNMTTKQNVVSFTSKDISLLGLNSTQAPTDQSGYQNISKWINATSNSGDSWLLLNISYVKSELGVPENSLYVARFNGTWEVNTSRFTTANNFGVNSAGNYTFANISSFGSTFAPLADLVAPNVTIVIPVTPVNNSFINANSAVINSTVLDAVSSIDTCTLDFDNSNSTMTRVGSGSFVSCNYPLSGMGEGLHNFTVYANDSSNNTGQNGTWFFTVDTVKPDIYLEGPENNTEKNVTNNIVFSYNTTDVTSNITNCSIYINETLTDTNTTVTESITQNFTETLVNGWYNWSVGCYDYAGNFNMSDVWFVFVNTSLPVSILVSPADNYYSPTTTVTFNCSGTDTGGLENVTLYVWYSADGEYYTNTTNISGNYNNTNWTKTVSPDGVYLWNCLVSDNSGNTDFDNNRTLTIDTLYPQIQFTTPTRQSGDFVNVSWIYANVSMDELNLQNFTYYLYNTTDLVFGNTLTIYPDYVNWTDLPDGLYYYNVTVYDLAGNYNQTETRNITLDSSIPVVNIIDPMLANNSFTNVSTAIINASATDGGANISICTLKFDGSNQAMDMQGSGSSVTCNATETSLGEGLHNFTVYANDSANNLGQNGTWFFTVDTLYPQIQFMAPTPNNNSNITGAKFINASASDTNLVNITIYMDGTVAQICTSSPCDYRFDSTLFAEDSIHNFTAIAIDSAGNINTTGYNFYKVDNTAPTVNLISPPTPTDLSYVNTSTVYINSTVFDSSGISACVLNFNGTDIDSIVGPTDTCNFTVSGLNDGLHNFTLTVNDSTDPVNVTGPIFFTVDTIYPQIDFVAPTELTGKYANRSWIYANVNIDELNLQNFTYSLYNTTDLVSNNTFTTYPTDMNWTGLPDGLYYYNVTVYDLAGNYNQTETRNITLDNILPTIQFVPPTTNNGNYNQDYIVANVTAGDPYLDTITIFLYNSTDLVGSSSLIGSQLFMNFTGLTDNTYFLNATANDTAGNSDQTETRTIVLDHAPPTVTIIDPTPANTSYVNVTTITMNASVVNGASAIDVCTLEFSNSNETMTKVGSGSSVTCEVTKTGLLDGSYNFTVYANETAGNTGSNGTWFFTVDTIYPLIQFEAPTPANNSNVTGAKDVNITASDETVLANITIFMNDTLVQTCFASPCIFTFDTTLFAEESLHNFTAFATDLAGNVNTTGYNFYKTDNTKPDISLITPPTPADSSFTNNSNITIATSVYDLSGVDKCTLEFNGTNISTISPILDTCNFTVNLLNEGTHNFTVYVNDTTDPVNNTELVTFTVDTMNPSVYYEPSTTLGGDYSQDWIFVNVTCEDTNRDTVIFNWNGTNESFDDNVGDLFWENKTVLIDGDYSYYVWCNDSATNSNQTIVQNVNLDTTEPTIQFVPPTTNDGSYSQNYIEANVTAADIHLDTITILLYNSTDLVGSSSLIGSQLFMNFTGLSDGVTYYLNATANDSLGHNNQTETRIITLDLTPPAVYLESPANLTVESYSNTVTFGYNTTDVTSDVANCSIYTNGSLNDTDTSITEGVTQNFVLSFPNGYYNWSVSCYDIAGNLGSSGVFFLNVSVNAPLSTLVSPIDNYNSSSNSVTFNCSATNDFSLKNITLYIWNSIGGVYYTNTTNISGLANDTMWTTTISPDDIYKWNCEAYDVSNLSDWDANRTFTVDTLYPQIQFVTPTTELTGKYANRSWVAANVSITELNMQNFTYYIYNTTDLVSSNTFTTYPTDMNWTGLLDGPYYYNATAYDFAGNYNQTETRNITLDTILPLVQFVSFTPASGSNVTGAKLINVTASDETLLANITIYMNGTLVKTCAAQLCNFTFDTTILAEESVHNFTAIATDVAGNTNTTEIRFYKVDNTPPTVNFITPPTPTDSSFTNNSNITIATSVYDLSGVDKCTLDFNGTNITINDTAGTCNFTVGPITDGDYYFEIFVNDTTDPTGSSGRRSVTVDLTPPQIQFVPPTPLDGTIVISASYVNQSINVSYVELHPDIIKLFVDGIVIQNQSCSGNSTNFFNVTFGLGVHTYRVDVNDSAGNFNTTGNRTIVVRPPTISVTSGGTSSTQGIIYTCGITTGQSATFDLRVGDSVDCYIKGELHNIRLAEILDEQKLAEVEIASPFRIALGTKQSYEADVDENGLNDTKVTLLSFAFPNRATITLSLLNEVAPIVPVAPEPTPTPTPKPAPARPVVPVTKVAAPPVMILGLIILLVLVIITAGYRAYISRRGRMPRRLPAIAIPEIPRPPVAAKAVPVEAIELQQKIAAIREELERPIAQARYEKPVEVFRPKAVAAKPARPSKPAIQPQRVYSALGKVETELRAPVKIPSHVWPAKPAKQISLPRKEAPHKAVKKKPMKKGEEKKFYKALGGIEKTLK